jgi:hypothetical protein
MRPSPLFRLICTAAVAAALGLAATAVTTSASASRAPDGYPGTTEKLDWPKGGTVVSVPPPPTMGPKP